MAYSIFNSGAAQAYANSFKPHEGYGGFEKVKSNIGKNTFSKIPFLNFQAEVEMAKAGLAEVAATHRQDMVNDASLKINELRYGDPQGGDKSAAKKAALARMLSSGAGAVASRSPMSGELMKMLGNRRDPLQEAVNVTMQNAKLDSEDEARSAEFKGALKAGLASLQGNQGVTPTPKPSSGGGQITVQAPQSPQLQTAPSPSVKSKVSVDDIMKSVLESRTQGEQK